MGFGANFAVHVPTVIELSTAIEPKFITILVHRVSAEFAPGTSIRPTAGVGAAVYLVRYK